MLEGISKDLIMDVIVEVNYFSLSNRVTHESKNIISRINISTQKTSYIMYDIDIITLLNHECQANKDELGYFNASFPYYKFGKESYLIKDELCSIVKTSTTKHLLLNHLLTTIGNNKTYFEKFPRYCRC